MLVVASLLFLMGCDMGSEERKKEQSSESQEKDTLAVLKSQIQSDSSNANLFYLRAKVYFERKEINQALRDISRAMQLDGNEEEYFVLLSDIYQEQEKYEDALDILRRVAEKEEVSSGALVKLAKLEMAFENTNKATRQINRAIKADPENAFAWFIKGYIYEEQDQIEEAIKHYTISIDKDADFVEPYINLGILYSDRGSAMAADYFNGALNIEPDNVNAMYLLGLHYQEQEKYDKAVSSYQNIIAVNPDYPHSYYNIGYIALVYQENYDKAIEYMNKAIEVQPAFYRAYYNLGYAHELKGDYQKAREAYKKSLQIMPNFEKAVAGMNRLDRLIR